MVISFVFQTILRATTWNFSRRGIEQFQDAKSRNPRTNTVECVCASAIPIRSRPNWFDHPHSPSVVNRFMTTLTFAAISGLYFLEVYTSLFRVPSGISVVVSTEIPARISSIPSVVSSAMPSWFPSEIPSGVSLGIFPELLRGFVQGFFQE